MSRVLGIDIGGSKSRARLAADDVIIADASAGSASLNAAGQPGAERALAALLSQLPEGTGPLDAVCIGAAGLGAPQTRGFLLARLSPLTRSGNVIVISDAALILPAAGITDGIAVIGGTGSIAIGQYRGRSERAGGWGYLLGDEGGGYWIVRAAVRTLLERRDRAEPAGALAASLLAATGEADLDALHAAFLQRPQPRHWARYAPAVINSGDPAAALLTTQAAAALAGIGGQVADRLGAPAGLPVVLAGGLMSDPRLREATAAAMVSAVPGCTVQPLAEPPVAGAVRLAAAAATARP